MSQPATQQIYDHVPLELIERMKKAFSIAVLAGAGASVAANIPVFRGLDQMKYFAGFPPAYLCSKELMDRSPATCWQFIKHFHKLCEQASPGSTNETLAA